MDLLSQVREFEMAAHKLFAQHEQSTNSRVISLEHSYAQLDLLNLRQDDLLRQSLRCAEAGLYRAAHVMCWAACMDYIQDIIENHGIKHLQDTYPKWQKTKTVSELAEYVPEAQLIGALEKLGVCSKNQVKALIGLLNKRNECAHPSDYLPGANETLGYISEVLQRIKSLTSSS